MNRTLQPAGPAWIGSPLHHRWLAAESDRLLAFFEAGAADARGGFSWLRADGTPDRGWYASVTPGGEPVDATPDHYHAFQTTLFARAPQHLGLAEASRQGMIAC